MRKFVRGSRVLKRGRVQSETIMARSGGKRGFPRRKSASAGASPTNEGGKSLSPGLHPDGGISNNKTEGGISVGKIYLTGEGEPDEGRASPAGTHPSLLTKRSKLVCHEKGGFEKERDPYKMKSTRAPGMIPT